MTTPLTPPSSPATHTAAITVSPELVPPELAGGTAPPRTPTSPRTDLDRRTRRIIAAVVILAVLAAVAAAIARGSFRDAPYEPSSSRPDGSAAVAAVLREDGVDVREARRTADAADALRAGRTVLVTDPSGLSRPQLEALSDALDEGTGHLVLLTPDFGSLSVLAPGVRPSGTVAEGAGTLAADPRCGEASFRARTVDAGPITLGEDRAAGGTTTTAPSILYQGPEDARSCFADAGGASIVRTDRVTVLGSAAYLTNGHVSRADNSAVALNALGGSAGLTWYLPSATDPMAPRSAGPLAMLPAWLLPTVAWLLVCLLVWLLAVSRRLGPVVVEPLPVTVRAQELVVGRAHLLERSGARDRAARALRSAAAMRLAEKLGVRRQEPLAALLAALGPHTDRTAEQLHALLGPIPVPTDEDLVRLAHDLDALEKEIDR